MLTYILSYAILYFSTMLKSKQKCYLYYTLFLYTYRLTLLVQNQGESDVIKQKVFSRDPTLNYLKVVLHTYIHKYVRKKLYGKTSKHDVPSERNL